MAKSPSKAAEAASRTLHDGGSAKGSKTTAGSVLSQSGRKFGRTSDGVTIYKPGSGASNFTAKELRAAVSEARNRK